jgi:hypothetical protein
LWILIFVCVGFVVRYWLEHDCLCLCLCAHGDDIELENEMCWVESSDVKMLENSQNEEEENAGLFAAWKFKVGESERGVASAGPHAFLGPKFSRTTVLYFDSS